MSNEKNLIPFNKRTESEQREIAQQGGKASGLERARRAYMKQSAREIILKMYYFNEAAAELEAEWKEFQRWRKRKEKRKHG